MITRFTALAAVALLGLPAPLVFSDSQASVRPGSAQLACAAPLPLALAYRSGVGTLRTVRDRTGCAGC